MPLNNAGANAPRESATIVPFPVGGRAGLAKRAIQDRVPEMPAVSYGSWYHDEAIQEAAEAALKNSH